MRINITEITGIGTIQDKAILQDVLFVHNKLWKTTYFKERFFKIQFSNTVTETHQQVWDKLTIEPIDVVINFRDRGNNAIPGSWYKGIMNLNIPYWRGLYLPKNVGTFNHEATHKYYKHAGSADHGSVPYAVGNLITRILNKHIQEIKAGKDYLPHSFFLLRWFGFKQWR